MTTTSRRNGATAIVLCAIAAVMIGMSYAAVPLYRLFCQVTGFGGTTQVSEAATGAVSSRVITVRFDANTGGDLPWRFRPVQRRVDVRIGEETLAFYRAENRSGRRVVGTATFNVTPHKAGPYFDKIDCFCFTEQALDPGEVVDMPVSFFIDPAVLEDPDLDDVTTITLSYTFFEKESGDSPRRTSSLRVPAASVN
jgi:cytochrome c oxidase assembly protein subunit 11